jgi:hypothetical protein
LTRTGKGSKARRADWWVGPTGAGWIGVTTDSTGIPSGHLLELDAARIGILVVGAARVAAVQSSRAAFLRARDEVAGGGFARRNAEGGVTALATGALGVARRRRGRVQVDDLAAVLGTSRSGYTDVRPAGR